MTMRFFTIVVAVLLIGFNAYPQGQQKPIMEWIRSFEQMHENPYVQVTDVVLDDDGNTYVGSDGVFLWGRKIGNSSPQAKVKLSDNYIFVVDPYLGLFKYDANGVLITSVGNLVGWYPYECDFDSQGNLYTAGRAVYGGSHQFGDTTLTGWGFLIQKYDSDLNPIWARKSVESNSTSNWNFGISIDDNDVINLLWSSRYVTSISFLGLGVGNIFANPIQIARITTNAELLQHRSIPVSDLSGFTYPRITCDSQGSLYIQSVVSSQMTTTLSIDGMTIGTPNTAYILKYGPNLDLDWHKTINSTFSQYWAGIESTDNQVIASFSVRTPSTQNYLSQIEVGSDSFSSYGGLFFVSFAASDGSINWIKTTDMNDIWSTNETPSCGFGINSSGSVVFSTRVNSNNVGNGTISIDDLQVTSSEQHTSALCKFSFMNSRISGKVYQDYDLDHELDAGEPLLDGQIIQLTADDGSTKYRTTTVNGEYYFAIEDSGTYVVSYDPPSNFIETGGVTSVILVGLNDTLVGDVNFGVGYTDTIVDIQADITAFAETTFGSTFNTWTSAINTGNVTTNYSTVVSTDGLTAVTGFNQVDTVLQPGQVHTDNISLSNGTDNATATVSTTVISNTDLGSEIATNDNQDSVDVVINIPPTPVTPCCPYDPNDKTVFGAYCEANYVEIGDTLEYRIRFMNTGTAPANTVILIDTLDASVLDLRTFRVIGHSHPMYWDISGPGKLTITYPDINLPDSSVSFLGSQGFFKFRIVMRDTVSNLTQSGSSAFIYFDNEAPIETNEPTIIAVDSIPVSELTATDAICGGESGLIDASISFGIVADSAYWSNGSTGLPLPYNDEGTYTVELVDEYGCRYLDSIAVSCNILTSIEENGEEFNVYPNPSNGKYYINAKGNVRVFDVSGKEVYRTSSFNAPTEVDLSALPSGLYTILLTNKGGVFTGRVVRE
jgi:uncharacterized repeat protein (TIGR01451 family)